MCIRDREMAGAAEPDDLPRPESVADIPPIGKYTTFRAFYSALTVGVPGVSPPLVDVIGDPENRQGMKKQLAGQYRKAYKYLTELTKTLNKYPRLLPDVPQRRRALTELEVVQLLDKWRLEDRPDAPRGRRAPTTTQPKPLSIEAYLNRGLAPLFNEVLSEHAPKPLKHFERNANAMKAFARAESMAEALRVIKATRGR
jgi:hypothetical protein